MIVYRYELSPRLTKDSKTHTFIFFSDRKAMNDSLAQKIAKTVLERIRPFLSNSVKQNVDDNYADTKAELVKRIKFEAERNAEIIEKNGSYSVRFKNGGWVLPKGAFLIKVS